ncbi:hypothetical protein Acr_00g0019630 [Actinidia rufa]|uniref:Uncharacterized protein n=1 Tax=Actinidia rufa TaxID=165716 RepID=A0A7J0DDK0_9ERIC|nr:hypothetical protein Acr_00g0019630 [Actinidia rufa]
MELNRAQLLVHDDTVLAQFHADHNIPDDVLIERSGPNEDANWVEGEGNHIPPQPRLVTDALDKDLYLDEFVWVFGNWEFYDDDLDHFSFSRFKGYVLTVNNCRKTQKVVELLNYVLVYCHVIPHRADRQRQLRLPPLHIRERAPRRSLSIEVSDLIEGATTELVVDRSKTWAPRRSLSRRRAFPPKKGKGVDRSVAPLRIGGFPELWDPKFIAIELGKQVTNADSSRDLETCLALRNAITLLQDVVGLAIEDSEEFKNKLIMANLRVHTFENDLKQSKLDLAMMEKVVVYTRGKAEATLEKMNKTLQENTELKKVASREVLQKVFDHGFNRARDSYEKHVVELHPNFFQEGGLAFLKELGIPSDHPAWNSTSPPIEPLDPPTVYSPLILLGF